MSEAWLKHPAVRSVLGQLIDLCDAKPLESRSRSAGFRLTHETLPELFEPNQPGDDAYVWGLLEKLEDRGWISIKRDRPRPGMAPYEMNPRVTINPQAEAAIRSELGREDRPVSETVRWRAAVSAMADRFPGIVDRLSATPIRIPGKTPEEIAQRLTRIPREARQCRYVRELSARVFWGLSKVIDNRLDAISEALGPDASALLDLPILLHVAPPEDGPPTFALFIENEVCFLAACARRSDLIRSAVLIYASGYKLAAARLRDPSSVQVFYLRANERPGWAGVTNWLFGGLSPPCFFWGDLDYAGLGILAALRSALPQTKAWQPGYELMVEALREGKGHRAEEAGKTGQVDPGQTGCEYADAVLLPLLRETALFLDQEFAISALK